MQQLATPPARKTSCSYGLPVAQSDTHELETQNTQTAQTHTLPTHIPLIERAEEADMQSESSLFSEMEDALKASSFEKRKEADREKEIPGLHQPSAMGGVGHARPLADIIVNMGYVERGVMNTAITEARASGTPLEQYLVKKDLISEDDMAKVLAERYGIYYINLSAFPIDPSALSLISNHAAKRYEAAPVAFLDEHTLLLAIANPSNVLAVDDLAIMTGYEIRLACASKQEITDLIMRMDKIDNVNLDTVLVEEETNVREEISLRESAADAPVVKLVNQIIAQAVEQRASDIHFSPEEKELRVRFRIDGILHDITSVPKRLAPGVISRVKIMTDLDISEKRMPQDGRAGLSVEGRHIDLRIVTVPSARGEAAVMRILDKGALTTDLDKLGMADEAKERFEQAFHASWGGVLVTGPTGSGKTTTLYAALMALNSAERNLMTVEDPVEYQIEGLTQVQVQPKLGLTFAKGLRTLVRADPDVIMIGEIRDRETAQIAIESALTGHLVLSTLHTNDAPSALHRLIEMGIEPFLVSSAVECVVAQRLVRTLCPHCRRKVVLSAQILRDAGYETDEEHEVYEAGKCPRCNGTGYRGRIGIYEVMSVSREIAELALARRSADEIREVAMREGMRSLQEDGIGKVLDGQTSMPEILRVLGS